MLVKADRDMMIQPLVISVLGKVLFEHNEILSFVNDEGERLLLSLKALMSDVLTEETKDFINMEGFK